MLFPNLATESGETWTKVQEISAVRVVSRLWALLFPAGTEIAGSGPAAWPEDLAPAHAAAAFSWLDDPDALIAWLNTDEASAESKRLERRLWGAPPSVVERVHDKAFCLSVAEREGLVPDPLKGLVHAVEPAALGDPGSVMARLGSMRDAWPEWAKRSFTLKPRIGTSGRGRVAGFEAVDTPEVRGALPRLASRGGAIFEPWLDRTLDLSAQLYVDPGGSVEVLGTLEQIVSPAGIYRAHRGRIDPDGRVRSGTPHDDALVNAARVIAGAAAREGFHGPCGIDAFVFRAEGKERLRPVVELNARFTTGTVVLGLLRRVRARLEENPALHSFEFLLDAGPAAARVPTLRLSGTVVSGQRQDVVVRFP